MPQTLLVVVLALGAALCIAIGTTVRQRTAATVPVDGNGAKGPIAVLFRRRVWWVDTAFGVAGFGRRAAAFARSSANDESPVSISP